MKPSTLIVMSVGLVITVVGFALCLFAQSNAKNNYPEEDLFSSVGENYMITDNGDTVRTMDFSDVIQVEKDDGLEDVEQDVKVLSVVLSGIDDIEIIGRSTSSKVMLYNFQPGLYACQISSGVITVTNKFQEALLFDYLSDAFKNFNGLRTYFRPDSRTKNPKKVVITVNDDDLLNRIDLELTDCKNVKVKNLTCSLDCKIILNNSDITFESCSFKDREIVYPEPDPDILDSNGNMVQPEPIITEHFLTIDLNMKNGSSFTANACKFSSVNAVVNKKLITQNDVDEENSPYLPEQVGTYVSNGGQKCTLNLNMNASGIIYGYSVKNVADENKASDTSLVTVVNGYSRGEVFTENAENKDFPPITIDASNCAINIFN